VKLAKKNIGAVIDAYTLTSHLQTLMEADLSF